MKRHAFVTFVALAACGPQQTRPAPEEETPIDAAPTPVVVVPPDAGPLPPPEVPPLQRVGSADELRVLLKAAKTDDERIVYLGQLAELSWAGLCATPTDGLCFTLVKRAKKAPPTCDMHVDELKLTARPADKADEVVQLIGELRQQWGGGSAIHEITDPNAQAAEYISNFHMAEAYGVSLLILGDHAFEQLLAIKPLTGLDFDPDHGAIAKKSMKRFDAWFQEVMAAGSEAQGVYTQIFGDPELLTLAPAAVVAAYGRSAQLQRRVAANLYGMEVPTNIRKDQAFIDAFCGTLDEKTAGLDEQAKTFEDTCKTVASANGLPADRCGP